MTPDQFYDVLITDAAYNQAGLDEADYAVFRRYYRSLCEKRPLRPFFRYNWQSRIAPMRQLLQELPAREMPWRILDAGCGVGTESIYWVMMRDDVEVVGVDLSVDRLDAARARAKGWAERGERPLPVQFCNQNIFDVLGGRPFDLIWTMEAISHIDPAESFLSAAFDNLTPGGSLVISDSHLLNPAMIWRLVKMRRHLPVRGHKTVAGGGQISYAHERLFAVPRLARLLRQTGFSKVNAQLSVFFPPSFARRPQLFRFIMYLERFWNKLPIVRQIGGIYTIVAAK